MDWSTKALVTAATVALLLAVARRFGQRAAGMLAGLPTVTGPALIWLALDHGPVYAFEAAIGSVSACLPCAAFALAYERASRRFGIWIAVTAGCVATLALASPLQQLSGDLLVALFCAGVGAVLVHRAMPDDRETERGSGKPSRELLLTAIVSGAVSGIVSLAAPGAGPFWAGVLASPPLIAAVVAMHQHAHSGHPSVRRFLRGYVAGLLGRAVFAAGFALFVQSGLPTATLLATAAASACTAFSLRWSIYQKRMRGADGPHVRIRPRFAFLTVITVQQRNQHERPDRCPSIAGQGIESARASDPTYPRDRPRAH